MTSAPRVVTILAPDRPPRPLRLMLKPEIGPMVASTGHVDGAWWPRSRDLDLELPVLAKALAAWLGRVERVSYNLTIWAGTVRRIRVDGASMRLAGYRLQDPDTVDVLGHTHRITLLVVPPEATEATGHQAMALAADPANTDNPTQLLVTSGVRIAARTP
jgi:uncharacterized protein DUF5994